TVRFWTRWPKDARSGKGELRRTKGRTVPTARAHMVGLVVHYGRPAAIQTARDLVERVRASGASSRALEGTDVGADEVTSAEAFPPDLDLVVSIGGDGTLLRAAELAARAGGAPVLAVNVGRLGFLTEARPDEAAQVLGDALRGEAMIEERVAIVAEPESAPWM